MKHNKSRNVGILFELLNYSVLERVANNDTNTASDLFILVKKYFMNKNSEIFKSNNIYSKVINNEARNHFYASRFLKYLIKEHEIINNAALNAEISSLLEDVKKIYTLDKFLNNKIQNYKLFASFKCLVDDYRTKQILSSEDRMKCESIIFEHLIHNENLHREEIFIKKLNEEELEERNLAIYYVMKKFCNDYRYSLKEEQKQCLFKYLSSDEKSFSRWSEKKIRNILEEITNKIDHVEDSKIKEILDTAFFKYRKIVEKKELGKYLTDIILSFELKETLKLF